MGRIDPRLGLLLLFGGALSRLVWIGSDIFAAPRVLFAFARDGHLPAWLGRVTKRGRVPAPAIAAHAVVAAVLALTGAFEQLAVLSVLAACGLYIAACLAAWRLARRGVAELGPRGGAGRRGHGGGGGAGEAGGDRRLPADRRRRGGAPRPPSSTGRGAGQWADAMTSAARLRALNRPKPRITA